MPLEIRGLPRALHRDAWWFCEPEGGRGGAEATHHAPTAPAPTAPAPTAPAPTVRPSWPIILGAIALWDLVVWQDGGLGALPLVLCSVVWGGAIVYLRPQQWRAVLGLLVLSVLPILSYVQFLSVLMWLAGMIAALGVAHRVPLSALWLWGLRLPFWGWLRWGRAAIDAIPSQTTLGKGVLMWLPTFVLGMIFVALFAQSNPVFHRVIYHITAVQLDADRISVWGLLCLIAVMIPKAQYVSSPSGA
ncbi:MAG: hypothetical protein AAF701_03985, partial [Pseudomonadota bacterium]